MNESYFVRQIKALESLAVEAYSIPETILMERAGESAWNILQEKWPHAKHLVVFCGPGNNGGDGYVLARLAKSRMKAVRVYYVGALDALKPPARTAYEACVEAGIDILPAQVYQDQPVDIMVDALLGIGYHGALREEFAQIISLMNHSAREAGTKILALDIPSGLLADTGCVPTQAVKATCTVTFIGMKVGLSMADGLDCAGEVFCDQLQLPHAAYSAVSHAARQLNLNALKSAYLPVRMRNSHKGQFGHVLLIGGGKGMPGSIRMAAEAALRVGAGLVTIATHPSHASFITIERPEVMAYGIETPEQLTHLLDKASVIVLGMGLGKDKWAKACFKAVINTNKSLLLDADALNLLSEDPVQKRNWILTPHPGEAARLLKIKTREVQADRLKAIAALQANFGGVSILKGAGTVVKGEEDDIGICTEGNPGMASAGMGDVLSGVIGGLMAQSIPLVKAAELGVCLHAQAGDTAAFVKGERGLLAMDLMPYLQSLVG